MVAILLFAPMQVGVQGYFTLTRLGGGLDVKLFFVRVARIRLVVENGRFQLKLNDKPLERLKLRANSAATQRVLSYLTSGNLLLKGNLLAVLGGGDSKNGAILG